MLAKVMRRLLIVAAVTVSVNDVVGRDAMALAGNLCRAIRQQLHIARQHDLDRALDASTALWQLRPGLVGNVSHSRTPGLPGGLLETRRTCLFPRNLFYCYHCSPFLIQRVLYLAVRCSRT